MSNIVPQLGQLVQLSDNRSATVLFVGHTLFATGEWVGVSFDEPIGKNDGSVQGKRYFHCPPDHGMFLRPSSIIAVLEDATPRPEPSTALKTLHDEKDITVVPRERQHNSNYNESNAARRQRLNAQSPTPGARHSVTADDKSRTSSTSSASADVPAASHSPGEPQVLPQVQFRPGYISRPSSSRISAVPSSRTQSRASDASLPKSEQEQTNTYIKADGSFSSEGFENFVIGATSSVNSRAASRQSQISSDHGESTNHETPRSMSNRSIANGAYAIETNTQGMNPPPRPVSNPTHVRDLEAKLRLMEKRLAGDRERLKGLKKVQEERDRFEKMIQKLQAKYQPQQQELVKLRQQIQESQAKCAELEVIQSEHDTSLEMATLDREMAEENAETLRNELRDLKARAEELDEEAKLLREENTELTVELSPEERSSQSWLQMEQSHERMKLALVKLRNMTSVREAELKVQISALQADLKGFSNVKEQLEVTKERLQQAETAIEELKAQLDAALAAEELVEELTERNLSLNEQANNLKLAVDDLESLRDLNDEVEKGHVDAEKQLQEELDRRDALLADHQRRALQQDIRASAQEQALAKSRTLIRQLQSDLEHETAVISRPMASEEDMKVTARTLANINLRLQEARIQAHTNAANAELGRLYLQEAERHSQILQHFLPEIFGAVQASIQVYLLFERVYFKTTMLCKLMQDELMGKENNILLEESLRVLDFIGQLATMGALCSRLADHISHSTLEQFTSYSTALPEIESVDQDLTQYIHAWQMGQLQVPSTTATMRKHIDIFEQMTKDRLDKNPRTMGVEMAGQARILCTKLRNIVIELNTTKKIASHTKQPLSTAQERQKDISVARLEDMISSTEALLATGLAFSETLNRMHREHKFLLTAAASSMTSTAIDDIGFSVRQLSERFCEIVEQALQDGINGQPSLDIVDEVLCTTITSNLSAASKQFAQFAHATTAASDMIEIKPSQPPWVLLAASITKAEDIPNATHDELIELRATLDARDTDVHARDRTIAEQNVKLELLESRMHDAGAKAARIEELNELVETAVRREGEIRKRLTENEEELSSMRVEQQRFEAIAAEHARDVENPGGASTQEVVVLRAEIRDLQGAVRMLRKTTMTSRYSEGQMSWLQEPLVPPAMGVAGIAEKERQGTRLFDELLNMISSTRMVELKPMVPAERLAWRPANEKSSWIIAKQREDWQIWLARGRRYIEEEYDIMRSRRTK